MLALIYLAIMVVLGDSLCRRFYLYISLPHRLAAAFLSGLLISSWLTYLGALAFAQTSRPLLWGNLLFFLLATGLILWLWRRAPGERASEAALPAQAAGADKWDWAVIGCFFVLACWLMFSSFNMEAGKLQIANHQWSDFGPNVAIMQSFARGHNFPTEYPHFSGERIRYHFLFYFQAGNLVYLGLNPAWGNNLLSILSLVSMLILVMTLGHLLFRSRAVGRIGAALFFFHGSLSYIPFLRSHESVSNALRAATSLRDFLPSGFPYRGEKWGVWSQVVFLNQRHLASAIGILLLVLGFLVARYCAALPLEDAAARKPDEAPGEREAKIVEPEDSGRRSLNGMLKTAAGFILSGVLLGLLPMWNSAVFVAAFAVLALLLCLFPLKKQMLVLALTTAVVALPQVIYLKTGNTAAAGYSLFHWGYTLDNPTLANVIKYLGSTFGFKWLLIAFALVFATWFQRRVMLAVSGLVVVAFLFQFSVEALANHKFLNIWLIVANLFVAYGLWRLWYTTLMGSALPGRVAAVALTVLITLGGIIDLFPIRNGYWVEVPFEGEPLVGWVEQSDPKAIFLTDRFVSHHILLAGRRIFYGLPYYAWSAGYPTAERDALYRRLFEERNPRELLRLLQDNNISYVAIDDKVRRGGFVQNVNEAIYENNFERVFQDTGNRYGALSIFKVPTGGQISPTPQQTSATVADPSSGGADAPAVNAFAGGRGTGRGQFENPRGIAVDAAGHIYVADAGNSRIQKFSPDGEFLASLGKAGTGEGELREPNGIAVDSTGNIYVADALNHRLIKLKADGAVQTQWSGPPPSFYGPRDVAIEPNGHLYVLDQGRTRVVKLGPEGETIAEWGRKGTGEGEFDDPTGLAVAGGRVYVADAHNGRIQVFDFDGKFISQWPIPEWQQYTWQYPDLVFDSQAQRLYATSVITNEVLVFDADGKRFDPLKPAAPAKLDGPSALVLADTKRGRRLYVLNTAGARVSLIELSTAKRQK